MTPTLPTGWSLASYSGPDGVLRLAYRRYNGHDRLDVLGWMERHLDDLANGASATETRKATLDAEIHAVAARILRWPAGVPVAVEELLEWSASKPDLWAWLSRTLYPEAGEAGGRSIPEGYWLLWSVRAQLLRLLTAPARSVSPTSTSPGTPERGSWAGDSTPGGTPGGPERTLSSSPLECGATGTGSVSSVHAGGPEGRR